MAAERPDPFFDSVSHSVTEIEVFCPNCPMMAMHRTHPIEVPYFKEVIIMAFSCPHCGFKSSDVKTGGPVAPQGKKITLLVTEKEDLSRTILKSDTCSLEIPEIELEMQPGTLGGTFTTIEGILVQIFDQLKSRFFDVGVADDLGQGDPRWFSFFSSLKKLIEGEEKFTLILRDSLANSYIHSDYAPDPDPNMAIELFDRTWEDNEDLGLNDLNVEGYHSPEEEEQEQEGGEEKDGGKDGDRKAAEP